VSRTLCTLCQHSGGPFIHMLSASLLTEETHRWQPRTQIFPAALITAAAQIDSPKPDNTSFTHEARLSNHIEIAKGGPRCHTEACSKLRSMFHHESHLAVIAFHILELNNTIVWDKFLNTWSAEHFAVFSHDDLAAACNFAILSFTCSQVNKREKKMYPESLGYHWRPQIAHEYLPGNRSSH